MVVTNLYIYSVHQFSQSNKLNWLDPRTDVIDYTYHNDANGHFSLIDYFLASRAITGGRSSTSVNGDIAIQWEWSNFDHS